MMDLSQFADKLRDDIAQRIAEKIIPLSMEKYRKRLEMDLNRIAQARIAEKGLTESLTFMVIVDGEKSLSIIPNNPVLFRKLEMGEFNQDGTLRTPPHSVLNDVKAIIRV